MLISLLQDPRNNGGIGTLVRAYRAWMDANRPGERHEYYLDDSITGGWATRTLSWNEAIPELPRLLPRLHIPQYYGARRLVRRAATEAAEVHAVGASIMHGGMAPAEVPMLVWFATTIADERRPVWRVHRRARRVLYRATLPMLARLERRVLMSARRVLVPSPHTARTARALGIPAARIEIQPIPVDTGLFRPSPSAIRAGLAFVGRVADPRKGFDRVIDLLEGSDGARECGVDVVSTSAPPSVVTSRFGSSLRWVGASDDLPLRYGTAQLLLLPSYQEGFGIVAFEALACATPVVAFRCGGPDEFLARSGGAELVDDRKEFRRAVERLLADEPRRIAMGQAGCDWVRRHISASAFLADDGIFRL